MIDPLDRPEYGSLSAPPPAAPEPRRRPVLSWLITAAAVAFAVGLLANPWFEQNVRSHLPGGRPPEASPVTALQSRLAVLEASQRRPAPAGAAQMATQLDGVADAQASVEQRLADLEREVAELRARTESSLQTVEQGAESARTALLVGALRRAADRGQRLDSYEVPLRARFGATHGADVTALLALGRAPTTPDRLAASLARLSPTVERASLEGQDWWAQIQVAFAGVVTVRRAGDPSADPASRLDLARNRAAAGDIEGAVALISALPPAARRAATPWLTDARRYVGGMRALASLELAALTPAAVAP